MPDQGEMSILPKPSIYQVQLTKKKIMWNAEKKWWTNLVNMLINAIKCWWRNEQMNKWKDDRYSAFWSLSPWPITLLVYDHTMQRYNLWNSEFFPLWKFDGNFSGGIIFFGGSVEFFFYLRTFFSENFEIYFKRLRYDCAPKTKGTYDHTLTLTWRLFCNPTLPEVFLNNGHMMSWAQSSVALCVMSCTQSNMVPTCIVSLMLEWKLQSTRTLISVSDRQWKFPSF